MKTTDSGVKYFQSPEVALIGKTQEQTQTTRISQFMREWDPSWTSYAIENRTGLTDPELLTKFAGQIDYLSFAPGAHTPHSKADLYFERIRNEGHGSVLEHAYFSFLCWGISRSCTHEIVRHRAGFSYSQVSQRYVAKVRFVERLEYQQHNNLHSAFVKRIDTTYTQYEALLHDVGIAMPKDDNEPITEYRKKIRQVARSILPNETEAPIIITANVRAWRHFIEMRANQHAEVEIRRLAMEIYYNLVAEVPLLMADYEPILLPDGTQAVYTETRKV